MKIFSDSKILSKLMEIERILEKLFKKLQVLRNSIKNVDT